MRLTNHRCGPVRRPLITTAVCFVAAFATPARGQIVTRCANTIRDMANPPQCIGASSLPINGKLLPLGQFFFVDPAGNVGISNLAPAARLDVNGTSRFGAPAVLAAAAQMRAEVNGGARILGEQGNTAQRPAIGFFSSNGVDDGGGGNGIFRPAANVMAFATSNSERMRISSGGSVGIGTSSPAAALHVIGDVIVSGNIAKGSGSFKIDHPLDPANKYLSHSFVESPDMMNIYNGNIHLDADGVAAVELPDWFAALNRDYRYQLTAVGGPAPELHVQSEVVDGKFRIAGGRPGQIVSWQVTGIRCDRYAEEHRIQVEELKPEGERGTFMHPDVYAAAQR